MITRVKTSLLIVLFLFFVSRSAVALSGLSLVETLRNNREPGQRLSSWQITVYVILLIVTAIVVMYHFSEAWKILPGAHLISGTTVPRVQIEEDLLSIYLVSRLLILAFAILYTAFALARDDGWGYSLYLLAWLMSLFAQFKTDISVLWLAITTGIFLQGIGVSGPKKFFCLDNL